MINLTCGRLVGVLYGWLRVIGSKPKVSKFLGTALIPGSFKVDVSHLISGLKALNRPGRRGWVEGVRTSFDHSAGAQAMDLCRFSSIHGD